MPMPLPEVQVREIPGSRDDLTFQLTMAYPRGGGAINLRATSARELLGAALVVLKLVPEPPAPAELFAADQVSPGLATAPLHFPVRAQRSMFQDASIQSIVEANTLQSDARDP
ncbi:hypothetical protein A0H81_04930 [Grifola frondosa]|uniref:Uncharacterized protein n=1 Tax=Grifola frondosa TaxID=5627 RepID=A0A1C7MGC2_GRIFR|nr:hypothetical protein A0H81_04930 [Grifola frondosa]